MTELQAPKIHYSSNPEEPVFFYGGPFSNFVGGPFVIASEQPWGTIEYDYETVEHFFAASKATTREDHIFVASQSRPGRAKMAGRSIALREDWEGVKYQVMLEGLRHKFKRNEWQVSLKATGDRLIAEDSPTDFIWGIRDGKGGFTGLNLLGKALMQVRGELR